MPVLSCCLVGVSSFASTFPYPASSRTRSVVPMTAGSVSEDLDSSATKSSTKDVKMSSTTLSSVTRPERNAKLLDDALLFNSSAASELLSEMNTMRGSGAPQQEIETYINNLLDIVDDSEGALWTRIRPLARFSRRARRASVRRVLELSTPSLEETESIGDDADAELRRRRRRSFVVLLRALANDVSTKSGTAIIQLEKAARREANAKFQTRDLVNRLPEGLETPKYSVLASRSGYEIRRYEPFSVCSVAMNKPRPADASRTDAKISNPQRMAGASAFGALAGYLFGKNEESTAMKMTTPVLSAGDGDERKMSFILPSEFWNGLDLAPKPLDGSGVVLEEKEGGERAVVMFGGFAAKKDVDERTKQLLLGLAKDREWRAVPGASVTLAQYNDPFTPPWKRRNEVSVEVVRRQD